LKDAQPGDLPIWQPSAFELGINLQTAAAFGLAIPSSMISRAVMVIDK